MLVEFYRTLFDPGDKVCWGRSKYDTAIRPIRYTDIDEIYVCLNALKGTRKIENVTKFRNILLEFDKIPLDEQKALIDEMPYSAVTFSGNKSFHVVFSMDTPFESLDEYRQVVGTLYRRYEKYEPDTAVGHPAAFTRNPEAVRDNGNVQKIIDVRGRVSKQDFLNWLGPLTPQLKFSNVVTNTRLIPISVKSFIKFGATEGNRNKELYRHARALFRCGHDYNSVMSLLGDVTDLSFKEVRSVLNSAMKAERR